MIIVGIDRPYYPDVKFYEDEDQEKANKDYDEYKEEHDEDGNYKGKVFMAKIIKIEDIKTFY